jgi:uncharacterized protein
LRAKRKNIRQKEKVERIERTINGNDIIIQGENTLKAALKKFIDLQAIDLKIKKFDAQIADGHDELKVRRDAITQQEKIIAELEERISNNERHCRELEAEITDETAKIKERKNKLMAAQNNREYQILTKEIEDGERNCKQHEDETVQLMELLESLKASMEEKKTVCEEESAILAKEEAKVVKLEKSLQTKRDKAIKDRDKKTSKADPSRLKKYEKLRERRDGIAVVQAVDYVCQGCFMNIPPQLFNEVLKQEDFLSCPTCNRLMFSHGYDG